MSTPYTGLRVDKPKGSNKGSKVCYYKLMMSLDIDKHEHKRCYDNITRKNRTLTTFRNYTLTIKGILTSIGVSLVQDLYVQKSSLGYKSVVTGGTCPEDYRIPSSRPQVSYFNLILDVYSDPVFSSVLGVSKDMCEWNYLST